MVTFSSSPLVCDMSRDALDGEALVLELAAEVLKVRRQKMIAMAKNILEVRRPGISQSFASWTEEDVLREAGEALMCITQEYEESCDNLMTFLAMRNAIVSVHDTAQE